MPPTGEPARVLGPADTAAIVVGAVVGVGIFFTPSEVAGLTGSGGLALAAWALAGAIALCGALTFAELGGMFHTSGAQYAVLRDAYGPFLAFVYVFCTSTAILAGAVGIIALICAQNLAVAVRGAAPPDALVLGLAVVLIVGLAGANIGGVRLGARIQNVTVVAKILALVAVILLAVFAAPGAVAAPAATHAPASPAAAVLSALVPAFFSYGGWQVGLFVAGEVRDPQRNVPRAIVGGMVLIIVVYLLANWAYLRLLGVERVAGSKALAADAVSVVLPSAGRRVVAAAVGVSAFGVLNAQLLAGPRLVYGMAQDGRFFPVFGRLGRRTGTPAPAIALLAGMAVVLLVTAALAAGGPGLIGKLLAGVTFVDGIFFALTGAALIVLRRKHPDVERPVRVPGYPVVPILFVAGEIGVVAGAYTSPDVRGAVWIGLAFIAAGALLYAVRFRA